MAPMEWVLMSACVCVYVGVYARHHLQAYLTSFCCICYAKKTWSFSPHVYHAYLMSGLFFSDFMNLSLLIIIMISEKFHIMSILGIRIVLLNLSLSLQSWREISAPGRFNPIGEINRRNEMRIKKSFPWLVGHRISCSFLMNSTIFICHIVHCVVWINLIK